MRAPLRAFVSAVALLAASGLQAGAQTANPLAERENRVPPVVSFLQSQGVKLTFLGEEGGLRGYLGEAANGKMQTFYVTPDGRHVVAGILFRQGGDNVTGVQIGEMRARFEAASKSLGGATIGGEEDAKAAPDAQAPSADTQSSDPNPSETSLDDLLQHAPDAEAEEPRAEAAEPAVGDEEAAALKAGDLALPLPVAQVEGVEGNPSELWLSEIDRDTFLAAAEAAPFFEVGSRTAPSVLWMVADPQCPYCHRAWSHIRQMVYDRKLRVRVIMIAGLPGSEPIATDILSQTQPARRWLETEGGRTIAADSFKPSVPATSEEWKTASGYLAKNMEFAKRFGVDRTPFLGYVADGQLYTALGLPGDLDAFLNSLLKH